MNNKITYLGTIAATAVTHYNTCFVIDINGKYLLVDTGSSNKIIENLKYANIKLQDIHDIFLSHKHIDHSLGLIWILRRISQLVKEGKYNGNLNVYCNEEVAGIIKWMYKTLLRESQGSVVDTFINIIVVKDNDKININNIEYTFFDTHSNDSNLYGFECNINNKKVVFLGDEKCNPILYDKINGADYVMHEVFCLDCDKKNSGQGASIHSSVEEVAENMNMLNIKNLILYHSKDIYDDSRKEKFTEVAKQYFNGNVIVPNDMETIEIY